MTTKTKFFSIAKFVEFMNNKYNNPSGAIVYFEASQSFMNKFDKICVKPVMIKVQKLKDIYIKHEDIIKMFDGQLVLTFTENRSRHLPRDTQHLYYLTIEYNGFTYYKTEMFQSTNPKNVELIRKQIIRPNKEDANTTQNHEPEQEHEIPPDAF